ncbi:hypothetical protein CMO91_05440 [Candidatus Woesearchaeota archaeon]|nr:hypothetical protein [Candidatus Woesearchaeota archaeon]
MSKDLSYEDHIEDLVVDFETLVRRRYCVFDTSVLDATNAPQERMVHYGGHLRRILFGVPRFRCATVPQVRAEGTKLLSEIPTYPRRNTLEAVDRHVDLRVPFEFYNLVQWISPHAMDLDVKLPNQYGHFTDLDLTAFLYLCGTPQQRQDGSERPVPEFKQRPVLATADRKLCQLVLNINDQIRDGQAPEYIQIPGKLPVPWCFNQQAAAFFPYHSMDNLQERFDTYGAVGGFDPKHEKPFMPDEYRLFGEPISSEEQEAIDTRNQSWRIFWEE